ncbi:MAG: type II toxin-antitoxin system antitoxin SocA domain-containing protein, partial [Candidatus Taylorbacteria bacterium]
MTNETYIRLPKGPFAERLEKMIESAKKDKLIDCKQDDSEKFGKRNRFQAIGQPELSIFSVYEKGLLVNLCKTFKEWSTDQMIAQTHTEAPWVFSTPSKSLNYKD